ncbi:threonine ammonia-lyase [Pseudoclavibacter caeni]|jgi:threonine dehydratase|uniref:threonine ammonia-lyase n=1 Tax=Pseudoclavibacter caeni TaxID=908846 RepID=A0A7C8FHU9_9MICO|nr:threonine ammonia-lyase [Pseudoclavibacter caeni]KAB1631340.1 threonine ammonia-lyase [Pseudoclavibacter caeni]NYJ96734.1 threonine dehydratase [Pseudoclavibacter caeni]
MTTTSAGDAGTQTDATETPRAWTTTGRLPEAAPQLQDIERARANISAIAKVTPIERSKALGEELGHDVFLKCENLQRTGAYKVRGAYTKLLSLTDEERAHGVVAASAGNHAQGVALAARELGIKATIFMPLGVALPKLQATRRYGAEVVLEGEIFDQTLEAAQRFTRETGATFIAPYDDPRIIAGAGTIGLEIIDQQPDVETVVVPIGGGGLISGVATAVKQKAELLGRRIRVVGVQAEHASSYLPSLAEGHPTTVTVRPTIADGIAVGRPGDLNFGIVREMVDEIVTVRDDEIARAIVLLLERAKLVVEPAGAAAAAAILAGRVHSAGTAVAIVSGGNIDPLLLQQIIEYGLVELSRYATISVMLPDRPGQLEIISRSVAASSANVVGVLHTRHGRGLGIGAVELQISVETKGEEHLHEVLQGLRDIGYDPRVVR